MWTLSVPLPSKINLPEFKSFRPFKTASSKPPEPPEPSEPPRPPHDFPERLRAVLDEPPPRKSIIPGVKRFPITYRKGIFTRFKRRITRIVGTWIIRISPGTPYDKPRKRYRPHIPPAVKRRATRYTRNVYCKARELRRRWKNRKPIEIRPHFTRDRNIKHGMDYDGLVHVIDGALGDLYASREREKEARLAQMSRDPRVLAQNGGLDQQTTGSGNPAWPLPNVQQENSLARSSWSWDLESDDIYRVF